MAVAKDVRTPGGRRNHDAGGAGACVIEERTTRLAKAIGLVAPPYRGSCQGTHIFQHFSCLMTLCLLNVVSETQARRAKATDKNKAAACATARAYLYPGSNGPRYTHAATAGRIAHVA